MSEERTAKVRELFSTWDFKNEGEISVLKLQESGSVSIGPNSAKVFEALEAMDANGDKLVTSDEMTQYFTLVGEALSDGEFGTIMEEMLALAKDTTLIEALTAQAEAAAAEPDAADDDAEPEEEPAELSAARLESLERLFCVFAPSTSTPIELSEIAADCKVRIGPNEVDLLTQLQGMDANSDGKLTYDELCAYFRVAGSTMDDDSFQCLVGEMTDSASSKAVMKSFQAQGE